MLALLRCPIIRAIALVTLIAIGTGTANAAPASPAPGRSTSEPNWTRVSERPGSLSDVHAVARTRNGALNVAYIDRVAVDRLGIRTRARSTSGAWLRPTSLAAAWRSLAGPTLAARGPDLYAFWAGTAPVDAPSTLTGPVLAARLANGRWSVLPMPMTRSALPATGAQLASFIDPLGAPWIAWATSDVVGTHVGFDAAGAESEQSVPCCEMALNVARDARSGETFMVGQSTSAAHPGAFMRRVAPTLGERVALPGSASGGRSVARATRLSAVSRPAGGVYTAYCASVPCRVIRVVNQHGRGLAVTLRTPARSESITVAPAPGSRLWLSWADTARNVWATRSNEAMTAWSVPTSRALPAGATLTGHAAGDGAGGPLDLIINADGARGPFLWHARMRPQLAFDRIEPAPAGRLSVLRLRVHDAGVGVRSTITFRGARRRTTVDGAVTLIIPPDLPRGTYPVTAATPGYTNAAATVRVR